MSDPSLLESSIGYRFVDQDRLRRALTHRSFGGRNNERLEFLGDSILGFVIAGALYDRFPRASEGDLTRMRARLVRQDSLGQVARELKLQPHLMLGSGERKSGGHDRESILADALEAIIGAIYLDSDIDTVRDVLLRIYEQRLADITPDNLKDDKTRLQEEMQKRNLPLPVYEVIERSGKAHALTFTVSCRVEALPEAVIARGGSRRKAEQDSARQVLSQLGIHG